ncbi:MAG: transglycosylase SLT domain-containing protein [Candidatus Binatia bacterium]
MDHRSAPTGDQVPQASSPSAEYSRPAVDLPESPTASAPAEPSLPETDPATVAHDGEPSTPKSERVENHEKSAMPKSSPTAHGRVAADNRLLELLDKDLDKAVEQPRESRRLQFSQKVIDDPKVRHFVKYYSITAKNSFHELLERSGKYMPMIAKVLKQEGLPEELGYLALLESEFVVNATSRSGAVGLWQFIAPTARRYGLRVDRWVDERRDPVKSTRAAAAYLKDLHDYYGRWFLATAAYNAGPGNVDKALRQTRAKDFWSIRAKARLNEETRNFVPRFVAIALIAGNPQKYGFHDIVYPPPLDYEEVELAAPMKLEMLAKLAETNVSTIRNLNPALLRQATPPGESVYRLNLPVGQASTFLAKLNDKLLEKDREPVKVVTHEVKKGETLFSIARLYGLTARALMEFNGLKTARIRIGQKLAILLEGIRGTLR